MLFQCSRVEANFPVAGLRLENRDSACLVWDEHGGTFVLRAEGLEVREAPELQGEALLRLEAVLPEPTALARLLEEFAGRHALRLGPAAGMELSEQPMLAACHVPGKNLFIFCEAARVTLRRRDSRCLELVITGNFKVARVSSQETDLVIRLDRAGMGRLLAGLLAWTREG
jgi:hypothetical protein